MATPIRQRTRWCDQCQVPLLGSSCSVCGSEGRDIGRDLVPVFKEELEYLRQLPGGEWIPKSAGDYYLWSGGPDYYCAGRRVARISFADPTHPRVDRIGPKPASLASVAAKHVPDRMKSSNVLALAELEGEAIRFLTDTADANPRRTIVVPFSGGKDSLAVSILARKAFAAQNLLHVFGDTGIEGPDTLEFIEDFTKRNWRLPVLRSAPNVEFFDMCKVLGPPSRIKRWCCSTQKAFPLSVVYNALGPVLSFCGVRRAESVSRQKHERLLVDTKIADELMACPVIEWSDNAIWQYIIASGEPFNQAYRSGFRRVGCLHCPYNSDRSEVLKAHFYAGEHRRWIAVLDDYYATRKLTDLTDREFRNRWKVRAGASTVSDDLASMDIQPCEADPDSVGIQLTHDSGIELEELLKPFGKVRTVYDDGLVAQLLVVAADGELIFEARHSRPRQHVRITIHVSKSKRLLEQRIVRQLRKLSACVRCGACQMVCPNDALTVGTDYRIQADRCTQCQKCVTKLGRGCIAAHATNVSGSRKWA